MWRQCAGNPSVELPRVSKGIVNGLCNKNVIYFARAWRAARPCRLTEYILLGNPGQMQASHQDPCMER